MPHAAQVLSVSLRQRILPASGTGSASAFIKTKPACKQLHAGFDKNIIYYFFLPEDFGAPCFFKNVRAASAFFLT
jgi:hypothetical protein